jgi:PAS domain S-box-containing protein
MKLAGELAVSPSNILQKFVEAILEVTRCDSSGLRLSTKGDGRKGFYWPAVAGMWRARMERGAPRDFSARVDVPHRDGAALIRNLDWDCAGPLSALPPATECLLAPFYVQGEAVGATWAIMHGDRRGFDAEDERLMISLGRFASLAYQTPRSIETPRSEIVAREKGEARMRELNDGLESKVRRLFASNIIGVFIWDLDDTIIDANDAFLRITGHDRDDLVSGRLRWSELTPIEWRDGDQRRLAVMKATGAVEPYEKEFFRRDRGRVRVLLDASILDRARNEGVAFVVDLTDLEQAREAARESERRRRETQSELARANRLATMGQLAASIAHEVNQPIAAAVTNAHTALRWLEAEPPNLEKVERALARIVENGNRASEVIGGIRALVKKEPARMRRLEINGAIIEAIDLTRSEGAKTGVSIRTELADGLAPVEGDRVQLEQVMLNLILNAFEAMEACGEGCHELRITTGKTESGGVIVAVRDSGSGVNPSDLERIFDPFHTTKPAGLGLGLSVCRAIIEAHGGKLWASAGAARGAVFQFTLPPRTRRAEAT